MYTTIATNLPTSICSSNHVKVVAGLWRVLWVNSLHKLLEDYKRGQATDSATVERK
jgi:hypothetical protein